VVNQEHLPAFGKVGKDGTAGALPNIHADFTVASFHFLTSPVSLTSTLSIHQYMPSFYPNDNSKSLITALKT
jgi:hypothetical protein